MKNKGKNRNKNYNNINKRKFKDTINKKYLTNGSRTAQL